MNMAHATRWLRRMDWSLVITIGLLMTAGVMFIFSASYRSEDLPVSPFYRKQIAWAAIGAVILFNSVALPILIALAVRWLG